MPKTIAKTRRKGSTISKKPMFSHWKSMSAIEPNAILRLLECCLNMFR